MMQNTGNATNQSGILSTLNFPFGSGAEWVLQGRHQGCLGLLRGGIEGCRCPAAAAAVFWTVTVWRLSTVTPDTTYSHCTILWLQNLHCTDKFLTRVLTWLVYMQLLPFLSLICSKEQRAFCPLLKTCRHCAYPCICTWDQWKSSFEGLHLHLGRPLICSKFCEYILSPKLFFLSPNPFCTWRK